MSDELPMPTPQIVQSPQQVRLLSALHETDPRLGVMYDAATRMLTTPDFPDVLSLSAHAMREFMDKLPDALDLPVTGRFPLGRRFSELAEILAEARVTSECCQDGVWSGEVDSPLVNLLESLENLVNERQENSLSTTEAAAGLLVRLEPGYARRSPPMERAEVKLWTASYQYFQAVCHHGHTHGTLKTDLQQFTERLRAIELLLLNKMRPETASDYQAIDQLMVDAAGELGV